MRDRFTPAHAGNTPDCRGRHLRIEVHPRSRGEYRISVAACFQSSGSPPLTRGIRSFSNPLFQVARFTPAHAGNTSVQLSKLICNQVHPRSRGEYFILLSKFATAEGSPPLTRGIPIRSTGNRILSRFTPAHAGNTIILTLSLVIPKVHPRSRGEYGFKRRIKSCIGGSPPLTRGILSSHCSTSFSTRFTPAHAGNTFFALFNFFLYKVHPRSRGEYT